MYVITLPIGKGQFKQHQSYVMSGLQHFDIEQIAKSGQCFRLSEYHTTETGKVHYKVIAYNQVALVCQLSNENVELCCEPDSLEMWLSYFDIRKYDGSEVSVYAELSQIIDESDDSVLKETLNAASGIRILNQDLLETGITFITSANNNIPRITKLIDTLCEQYGQSKDSIISFKTFPDKETLLKLTEEDWRKMGFGFRAPYLVDFVRWYSIQPLDNVPSKKDLMKVKGIGDKVASCILLYSLHDLETVPMDVWMKKVKQNLYKNQDFPWVKYRGICQQYIYYYYRTVKEESQWNQSM